MKNRINENPASCQNAVIASADIQEITFKMVFSVPEGYSCFTDKSEEKFITIIKDNFNLIESGIGFSCFGIKIEVDNINDIEIKKNKINEIALSTLKLKPIEKPKPPKPPYAKYSTISNLSEKASYKEVIFHQVNYTDGRMFQKISIDDFCPNSRLIFETIKNNPELKNKVHDMVSTSFGDKSLCITFKQGLVLTEEEILDFINKMRIRKPKFDYSH